MSSHEEVGSVILPTTNEMSRRKRPQSLDELIPLVLDSVTSKNTKRAYGRALEDFFTWVEGLRSKPPFKRALVQRYLQTLVEQGRAASTVNQGLTAIRKLASEAVENDLLDQASALGIDRIKPQKRLGRRVGKWLVTQDANRLLAAAKLETNKGMRDRVLLGLMLECGLRREEAAALTVDQVQRHPGSGRTILADVEGKGGRIRTVPVRDQCAHRIRQWIKAAKITEGPLLRPVDKADQIQPGSMSAAAIYKQVREYSMDLGLKFAPHDLRRTFAQLAYRKDPKLIGQIKEALGHSNINTTEIYLGIRVDYDNPACDALDLDDEQDDE